MNTVASPAYSQPVRRSCVVLCFIVTTKTQLLTWMHITLALALRSLYYSFQSLPSERSRF